MKLMREENRSLREENLSLAERTERIVKVQDSRKKVVTEILDENRTANKISDREEGKGETRTKSENILPSECLSSNNGTAAARVRPATVRTPNRG